MSSATTRLALSYLAVIMVMSIGFSLALYQISSSAVNRGLRADMRLQSFAPGFEELRVQRLEEARGRLQLNLLLFNLLTLALGSVASFILARRTLRPIEDALDAQYRFTADASHELRTPLAAMQTEIEVALRDPKLTSRDARTLLASNLEELAKLTTLSEGLLKLTASEQIDFEPVELKAVVEERIKSLRALAGARKIKIVSELADAAVMGDRVSVGELAAILMANAIKYSREGGTIKVTLEVGGKQAILKVADNGIGIEAADLPHIFERFYRADSSRTSESADGHGLGLSIAKQIVEFHHGTIEAESEPGSGALFTVKLPLAKS